MAIKNLDMDKLVINEEGNIVKKKNTIKHSKENALEKHEQEELFRVLNSLDVKEETKQRYEVLVHLMMDAGLRVSEAIQTRSSWFNNTEDGVTLNIPIKDRDLRNLKRDWKPKTVLGAREVIFIDKAIGEKVRSFFIGKPKGLNMSRQRAGQIIKMLGEKMNKPLLHPHALRSTYANTLIYSGVNTTTLQYYMGWAHIQTALNYIRTSKMVARKDLLEKMRGNQ